MANPPPLLLSDGLSVQMMEYPDRTFREVLGMRGSLHSSNGDAVYGHVVHDTVDLLPDRSQMLICRMVNGGARGIDMGVLREGALSLLMQQDPVKVVNHWADVDNPEHERWTHLVHLLHCTEHLVLGMFWQHTEQAQLILVLIFPADVGHRFLSMPALSSRMRSRPAGIACFLPKKVGPQTGVDQP